MSDRSGLLGATRLLGLNLTPGKLRGLQRISNANGTLTMVALDQNSSMISMIKDSLKKKGENREPSFAEIVEAKVTLATALGRQASALLVRVEKSGGDKNAHGAPLGEIEPGWGVGKIKRMGADAVKLLAQFEPTEA